MDIEMSSISAINKIPKSVCAWVEHVPMVIFYYINVRNNCLQTSRIQSILSIFSCVGFLQKSRAKIVIFAPRFSCLKPNKAPQKTLLEFIYFFLESVFN